MELLDVDLDSPSNIFSSLSASLLAKNLLVLEAYTMDEDFGSSVWATPATGVISLLSPNISSTISQFDDFDEFGPQEDVFRHEDDDDDFGDFGEFGQAEDTTEEFESSDGFKETELEPAAGSSSLDWEPLRFDSHPSRQMLETQIDEILGPLWSKDDLGDALTDEDAREVGGLAQILVTPDR